MLHRSILSHTLTLTLAALGSLGALACDPVAEPDDAAPEARGALLFDLTEDELVEIHESYLADEDLELTRSRLTAPFDCSLYDDFCAEVGADAALEITGEMIDLAREGAPIEEIEALLDTRIHEVLREGSHVEPEDEDELAFRGSSSFAFHTQGDFRLGVRNGITTPAVGDRRAWTQASTWQKNPGLPWLWDLVAAAQICVNAGTNTQTFHYAGQQLLLESINPANTCDAAEGILEISTWHDRNTGGGSAYYKITVHGCATANLNGMNFSKCAPTYYETY